MRARPDDNRKKETPAASADFAPANPEVRKKGKIKLSESARARLLDASDLSRFEIRKPRESGLKSKDDFARRRERKPAGDFKTQDRGSRKNQDRHSARRDRRKK